MTYLLIKTKRGVFDFALRCGSVSPLELIRMPSVHDTPRSDPPIPEPVYGLRLMPFPGALQFILGPEPDAPTCYLDILKITVVSQEAA